MRVAAVDDHIFGQEAGRKRGKRLLGLFPRGNHQPDDPRRGQRVDQRFHVIHGTAAGGAHERGARVGLGIEADDLGAATREASRHVGAHAAQPHHADLKAHESLSSETL